MFETDHRAGRPRPPLVNELTVLWVMGIPVS